MIGSSYFDCPDCRNPKESLPLTELTVPIIIRVGGSPLIEGRSKKFSAPRFDKLSWLIHQKVKINFINVIVINILLIDVFSSKITRKFSHSFDVDAVQELYDKH